VIEDPEWRHRTRLGERTSEVAFERGLDPVEALVVQQILEARPLAVGSVAVVAL
jgi:hypothetical protein